MCGRRTLKKPISRNTNDAFSQTGAANVYRHSAFRGWEGAGAIELV